MLGRLFSFENGPFSGNMFILREVYHGISVVFNLIHLNFASHDGQDEVWRPKTPVLSICLRGTGGPGVQPRCVGLPKGIEDRIPHVKRDRPHSANVC